MVYYSRALGAWGRRRSAAVEQAENGGKVAAGDLSQSEEECAPYQGEDDVHEHAGPS